MNMEQRLHLVREHIDYMNGRAKVLRRLESRILPHVPEKIRGVEDQDGRFPPLPPRLPRPDYVITPGSLDRDDTSLELYLACEEGRMAEIAAFVEMEKTPSHAVLQYGLEQASFYYKPEVARYLLAKGAVLHTFCFMRTIKILTDPSGVSTTQTCILDKRKDQADVDSIVSLLQAFIDLGSWHPN